MSAGIRACAVLGLAAVTPALAAPPGAPSEGGRVNRSAPATPSAAATAWLAAFDDAAAAGAQHALDDPARRDWHYVPKARIGVALGAMSSAQSAAARALLETALGEHGARTAEGVVELEGALGALEEAAGRAGARARRDPGLYYYAVFGTPGPSAPWAWRVEGHHLSVNVTDLGSDGQVVAPLFIGANPAKMPGTGPLAGRRLLAAEEDEGRALYAMLDAEQSAAALISPKPPDDIETRNDPAVQGVPTTGLGAARMTPRQREQLRRLLGVYSSRMHADAARRQLERIERAGFERLHFAWAGGAKPGEGHYYRIHGPTVLIEYHNVQNDANHIHTVWRDLENDFGGDLLRRHLERHRHPGG